ncbi:hypothetical protein BU14_0116s0047 [Porphyra umbilicalis]|uniref:Uncharacterized protein n=1 Tax=Porphyra umbilicalis TaxID=2786 RepID=A0A1X6PBK7_PORUM|nr:hypothetical protein BU14_0116s0047 [Porphyra umbilicalis]|eukprot:OSX78227.1 hypothetical protein BU14_0116s0047 [Porphyra umbilicalis]
MVQTAPSAVPPAPPPPPTHTMGDVPGSTPLPLPNASTVTDGDAAACTLLAVFDFDRTLLFEANSDTWVFEELAPDLLPLLRQRVRASPTRSWTDGINWALAQLPARTVSPEAVLSTLRHVPWDGDMTATLRLLAAASPAVHAAVASDANTAYIETVLGAAGVDAAAAFVGGVWTNGAAVTPAGALQVVPGAGGAARARRCRAAVPRAVAPTAAAAGGGGVWADAAGPSLTAAPPRLVPLRWIWYRRPPDRLRLGGGADLRRARPNVRQVVYVGDGTNDVCPVLHLGAGDLALARVGLEMEDELSELRASGDERLTAKVISWSSPADILRIFREVLAARAAA